MTDLPRLLCVDDEPSTLDAVARVLRKDFQVHKAMSGLEGLEILKQHPDTAVVLSDQRMPGMTGIQFLTESQIHCPNAIRAIQSGQIDLAEMMVAINSLAIHRFILKPWDNDYLRLQMREAWHNHQLLQQRNHLEHLAITDPITQLRNHRYFQEHLRKEIERSLRHSHPLALVMIDVDHFKSFNDQFGHPEGDRLLKAVAKQIASQVRAFDLVCRYGGEEFSVIMPETGVQEAKIVAERVRLSFAQPSFQELSNHTVTMSLGVAGLPDHGSEAALIISTADQALYQAKRQGRNQTVVAGS